MNKLSERNYPELLLSLYHQITEIVGHAEAAFALTEYIRRNRGGRVSYVPKGRKRKPPEPVPAEQAGLFGPVKTGPEEPTIPEWIEQFRQAAAEILVARGLSAELAPVVAERVRLDLIGEWAYIPKGQRYDHALRNANILDRFTRASIDKICMETGLSEQRVYQVLNEELRRRQRRLFE